MKSQRQHHAPACEGTMNRIGELEFCFDVSEASRQLGAPEKLLMAVRAELLDIIDSTLADAARGQNDLQLEKLEIDLGAFPDPPDWQHVRTTLRQRLLAELTPYLYPASATAVDGAKTQRMPTRTTAVNLPDSGYGGMNSDVAQTSPSLTGFAAQASLSQSPLSGAAPPLFRSTRQMPHGLSAGKSDAPARASQDASHAPPKQRIFRFAPARSAVPPEAPDGPATRDSNVPPVRSITETLHGVAGGRSDVSRREHLLPELRWRRQNAPARLRAELAALSAPELLQVSGILRIGGDFDHEGFDGLEASLTSDTPARKSKLINRIERALDPKDASLAAQMQTTELTTALRGLFPDAATPQPDPQRLGELAESTLQVLADALTPTRIEPQGSAPSDPDNHSIRPDLTRMTIAELRAQIDAYLPKGAAELSASIDQLGAVSADHIEALRVVAQALLDGKPIDLEHARRAIRDGASDDGGATSAITNLLRALNVPEAEIVAFIRARHTPKFHSGGTGTQSEGPSNPTPSSQIQSSRSRSLKPASSSSGRDPAPSESTPGAGAESGDGRPGWPKPSQRTHTKSKSDSIDTPPPPTSQGNEHRDEPPLRQPRTGSSKDKLKALTEASADPVPTPDNHIARTSPATLRKGDTSGTTEAPKARKDAVPTGKSGTPEEPPADTKSDETSAPDRKRRAADDKGGVGGTSTKTYRVPATSIPVSAPTDNTGTTASETPEPISDPYPPDTASNQDTPERAQSSFGPGPEDRVDEPLSTSLDTGNTQMSERRLGDLFDAAAKPDTPLLREMFELIWRALPDVSGADGQDRVRYWQAALVAVLSTSQGHSVTERATDAFLTMAKPDEASRHNLLRVLLARLGYAQPGSDPILRRETCAVLESLLAGNKVPPVASAKTDPDAGFIPTAHAGLVIFHPYLPILFDRMALLTPQKHIRPEQLPRAAAALAALAHATPAPSVLDPLERLLLAMPDGAGLVPEALPDSDLSLIDSLLRSVLAQWPRLGQTSPASLCETFIRRTGIIEIESEAPRLLVDEGPYDMLLDGLPWALSPVALPWMTVPLTVIWRQSDD